MRPSELEEKCYTLGKKEFIQFLMSHRMLKNVYVCLGCNCSTSFVAYKRNIDGHAWRCMNSSCVNYKKYYSIRLHSFFSKFFIDLKYIILVILKYSCKTPRTYIVNAMELNRNTIFKIINQIVSLMPSPDFSSNKLGGPGFVVQIDETMLNFKIKSHRGRSPTNKTDALCMVEVLNGIERAYATVIPDKTIATIIPIICSQVADNSVIWTDEHRTYTRLSSHGYIHDSVCHKYEFITANGTNTQAVESFNNCIKIEIKSRKGIKTELRPIFLNEFCFLWNNKTNLLDSLLNLIKFF